MDYTELRARGLELCQALASDQWTDYNEHDPGVTILEQLCYALTDLGYRTNLPVEDILASRPPDSKRQGPDPKQQPSDSDTLFTGDRILTCSPLTAEDYQRLLYDKIVGVRNAWLQEVTDHPLGIRGLHKVLVETYGFGSDEDVRASVEKQARETMRSVRNLGEDFDSIEVLKPFPLDIKATLVINAGPNPAHVLAKALFSVQEGLVPHPRVVPLADSFAKNIRPDEIFVGPRLRFGAVAHDGDRAPPAMIAVKRVRQLLAGVPHVRDVKSLSVNGKTDGRVPLAPGSVPRLEPSIYKPQTSYPIRIETHGGEPQAIDANTVYRLIQLQVAELRNSEAYALKSMQESEYTQRPRGQDRSVDRYYSIQHQFPATYGVGRLGIADRFDELELLHGVVSEREAAPGRRTRRWAQSRQLKAYLLFFEQLLADHLAQLAHAGDLFALDSQVDRSYFSQPLVHCPAQDNDPPDGADVLLAAAKPESAPEPFRVCILDDRPGPDGSDPAEILLMSRQVHSNDEARRTLDEILRRGQAAPHYAMETSHHGDVRLLLLDSASRPLAHGEERFVSRERAHEGRTHLRHFLSRLEVNLALRDRYIRHVPPLRPIGLRIVDEIGRVLLSSYDVPTLEERTRREGQILEHGVHRDRYHIQPHANGEFSVLLCDSGHHRIIAFGDRRFASSEEAHREIGELARRLNEIAHDETLRPRRVQRLPDSSMVQDGLNADDSARKHKVQAYKQALERIVTDPGAQFLHRRNRFLDHLLARFGERFEDDALSSFDPRPYGERDEFYHELVEWKLDFLRDYVRLGQERGRGFDYTGAAGAHPHKNHADPADRDADNLSGLERRLYLLLGLQGHRDAAKGVSARRPLTSDELAHAEIEVDEEADAALDLRDYARDHKSLHAGEGLYVLEHVLLRPTTAVLPLAAVAENYRVEQATARDEVGRTWRLLLCRGDPARTPVAHYRHLFYTWEEADQWGKHLALQIEKARAQPAHFTRYVHLFNPVGAASHEEGPFYSHRISVFFSAWPIRARHRGFRELAQGLVYANCPAHIAAHCFWLGYRDMQDFETLHAAWMKKKAAAEADHTHNGSHIQELDRLAHGLEQFIKWVGAVPKGSDRHGRTGMPRELADLIRQLERGRHRPAAR